MACAKSREKTAKVLVVDDEQDTCIYASMLLEKMGISARWVKSGNEVVHRVLQAHEEGNGYDVCLIDWKMPGMDGVEVTRRMRERIGPETLIIIISAYDLSEVKQAVQEAGANAFIAKPLFASTLYNVLVSALNGKPVSPAVCRSVQNPLTAPVCHFAGKRFLLAQDNELNAEIVTGLLKTIGATKRKKLFHRRSLFCLKNRQTSSVAHKFRAALGL